MRNPTERSPSSSSRASTSSIKASESAFRSSANDEDSLMPAGLDLQDVGEQVPDHLEHLLAIERTLLHVGLCWHGVSWVWSGIHARSAAAMIPEHALNGLTYRGIRPGQRGWDRYAGPVPIGICSACFLYFMSLSLGRFSGSG